MTQTINRTRTIIALLLTAWALPAAAQPAGSNEDDVMKTVRQWVDGLNKGNTDDAVAACARDATIVDEYPPYHWQGEGTCARWVTELTAYNKSIGLTDGINTLHKPRRVDITGDHAYVVVPADFRYKLNGKKGAEIGALFTVALQKQTEGWRITGWAWSRP
jgi:ketosteroid isomerase-like protein